MPFVPPRCPNGRCEQHVRPIGRFWTRAGAYWPRCRSAPVPRFRCKSCTITFSRQTFRVDYRDRRPDCNTTLFLLLSSGVGLRQSGRLLGLDVHAVQKKMRKVAATATRLHENLSPEVCARTFVLDEEETFEGASIRPLTVPMVVEKSTWFVVAFSVGSIRRLAKPGTLRRARQDAEELRHGRRRDESRKCVRDVLQALERRVKGRIELRTDEKPSYRTLAKGVFGDRIVHDTTPGTQARTTRGRLFPSNATCAMTRDNLGRLRRRSWLVSKHREQLRAALAIFAVYRNYVRRRFNRDEPCDTPARRLGLLPRQLQPVEACRWRQDWGPRSPHPMSFSGALTIADLAHPGDGR